MIVNPLFLCSQEEFNNYKRNSPILLQCLVCDKTYTRTKHNILNSFKSYSISPKTCSNICSGKYITLRKRVLVECKNCNKNFRKRKSQMRCKNNFCSQSCAATYNNKHRTYGCRRSKLEVYLEECLNTLHPNLEILYSNKTIINSELDIYIPSLRLAIEIQGIFHYKPIFGEGKLKQIQKNDKEKVKRCKELNIKLHCIDTTKQQRFTEESSKIFLYQINALIIQYL